MAAKLAAKNEALGKAVAEAQGEVEVEKSRSATLSAKLLKTKEHAAKQISAKDSRASKVRALRRTRDRRYYVAIDNGARC